MEAMTKTSTHTPGPYRVGLTSRKVPHVYVDGPHGGLIARCDTNKSQSVNEANARLISAAPELLVALKNLMHETDDGQALCAREFADAARAAIAKAEPK